MTISKDRAKQLLLDLIFTGDSPTDWVEDVWALSPTLAESAAKLVDVSEIMLAILNEAQLEKLLRELYQNNQELLKDSELLESWQQLIE